MVQSVRKKKINWAVSLRISFTTS